MKILAALLFGLCFVAINSGCVKPPPKLGPQASAAFQKTRIIKVLDLIRDTAIDGNAQTPPLFSTKATRKVVLAHQTALKVIQASDAGWSQAVGVALSQLSHDPDLLPAEVERLAPYFELVGQLVKGIPS